MWARRARTDDAGHARRRPTCIDRRENGWESERTVVDEEACRDDDQNLERIPSSACEQVVRYECNVLSCCGSELPSREPGAAVVRTAGVEPARGCPQGILSPLRLPVPPRPRGPAFITGGAILEGTNVAARSKSTPRGPAPMTCSGRLRTAIVTGEIRTNEPLIETDLAQTWRRQPALDPYRSASSSSCSAAAIVSLACATNWSASFFIARNSSSVSRTNRSRSSLRPKPEGLSTDTT